MTQVEALPRTIEIDQVKARLAELHLRDYLEYVVWPILEPSTPFVGGWPIDAMCEHLEAVTDEEIRHLLITIPPRHTKSTTVSIAWPTWSWIAHPEIRFMFGSYAAELSTEHAVSSRRVLESGFYRAHYGDRFYLVSDQNVKTFYENSKRGYRMSSGVQGTVQGRGGDVLCFDDPHNLKDIDSDVARTSVLNVFRNVWSQRFNDAKRGHYVVVMQRGHEDDLANMVMERGGFEHLNLPSEYERTPFVIMSGETIQVDGFAGDVQERDEVIAVAKRKRRKATVVDTVQISAIGWQDPRDQDGELLWPARFGPDEIAAAKRDLLETGFATQHQQRPVPQEGAMFKRAKFQAITQAELTELGTDYVEARGWDFAATEETPGKDPDYTVGAKVRRYKKTGHIVVMDIVRGRYGPAEGDTVLHATTHQDGRGCLVREEQEPGASGKKVIAAHVLLLVGYDYSGVRSTGDKTTKAKPFSVQVDNNKVWILAGEWNTTYLAELMMFPKGKHDDQVDSSVIAFNEVALGERYGFKRVKVRGTH